MGSRFKAFGVLESTGYVHTDGRCTVEQAACLDDEVFECGVIGIRVDARTGHFTTDGESSLGLQFVDTGNNQYVFTTQRYVGSGTVEESGQVDSQYFVRKIFAFAGQDGTTGKGIACKSFGTLDEFFDSRKTTTQFVHAGTIDGATDFDAIGIAVENSTNGDGVAVSEMPGSILFFSDAVDLLFTTCAADETYFLAISITGKSSGIVEKGSQAFVLFHFVEHGTFHVATDVNQHVIRRNNDDVAFLQAGIIGGLSLKNIVVDIDFVDLLTTTYQTDVAQ